MSSRRKVTFQDVLDMIESLPEEQQEKLIAIIRRRLIDHKRGVLAERIKEAREDYRLGKVRRGTVDDLMKEISE
jgi:putative heme iron utilization protein